MIVFLSFLASLLAIAPDRLHNEKTGILIEKEVLQRIQADRRFRKCAPAHP
jgi:hypothetical protein